jgi:chaperonin GroEL
MAAKMLAFDIEARKALLAGVSKLARAVKATLGPREAIKQLHFNSYEIRKLSD